MAEHRSTAPQNAAAQVRRDRCQAQIDRRRDVRGVSLRRGALGIGCRLAMRVVALLAGDADQGKLTDAEVTVGEVTAVGTIFLALARRRRRHVRRPAYRAVRRRLAWAGRWRGLAFGGLLLAIFGSALVEGSNPDFDGFGMPIVNVAMFATLFVFFGILIAPVYDDLQRAVAAPSTTIAGYALFAAQGAGMLLLVPATLLVMGLLIADGGAAGSVRSRSSHRSRTCSSHRRRPP